MKKNTQGLLALSVLLILFQSCSISKYLDQNQTGENKEAPVNSTFYVQFNDGELRNFQSLKLVTSAFATPYLLADGKEKIRAGEIKAYLMNDLYAVSQQVFITSKTGKVAVETLPGFAIRVVKGQVNVYRRKIYNGETLANEYFIQSGDEGEIRSYTPEGLKEMVKTDPGALDLFNAIKGKKKMPERLLVTVEMYNQNQSVSKN